MRVGGWGVEGLEGVKWRIDQAGLRYLFSGVCVCVYVSAFVCVWGGGGYTSLKPRGKKV